VRLRTLKIAANLEQQWIQHNLAFKNLLLNGELAAAVLLYHTVRTDWQDQAFDTTQKLVKWRTLFNQTATNINKHIGVKLYNLL